MNRSSEAPRAHILTVAFVHLGLASFTTVALSALSPHPPIDEWVFLGAFLWVYASLAPLVFGVAALTHQAGWLRWTSGDLNQRTRQLGAKLADPSQEF